MIVGIGAALSLMIRPPQPTTAESIIMVTPVPTPKLEPPKNWALYINTLESYAFYYPSDWELVERSEKARASAFEVKSSNGGNLRVWTAPFPVRFGVQGSLVTDGEIFLDGVKGHQKLYQDKNRQTALVTDFIHNGTAITLEFTILGEPEPEWKTWNIFRGHFHFLN